MTTPANQERIGGRRRCCDEDFGGSHYHCGRCRRVSGMMGCAWKDEECKRIERRLSMGGVG